MVAEGKKGRQVRAVQAGQKRKSQKGSKQKVLDAITGRKSGEGKKKHFRSSMWGSE